MTDNRAAVSSVIEKVSFVSKVLKTMFFIGKNMYKYKKVIYLLFHWHFFRAQACRYVGSQEFEILSTHIVHGLVNRVIFIGVIDNILNSWSWTFLIPYIPSCPHLKISYGMKVCPLRKIQYFINVIQASQMLI